jgi:hypothetical protein
MTKAAHTQARSDADLIARSRRHKTTAKNSRRAHREPPDNGSTHYAQQDAFARKDLLAIRGYFLSTTRLSDEADERFLHALLLKGLPATQVLDLFPWARHRGVDYYIDRANADRRKPNADRLGELIEFEFDDLKAMKRAGYSVRHVAPYDAQRWEVAAFWEAEEHEADRERKQRDRKRRKESTMPTLTKRAKIVHKALSEVRWTSVPAIMKAVALRDQRNRLLAPHGLRSAVRRALDELVAIGLAEAKNELDERGVGTRFARRAHVTGQNSVHVVSEHVVKKASDRVASQ